MSLRFHLDEDVTEYPALTAALLARGIDMTNCLTAGLRSAGDEDHLDFATRNGRVLVTHNVRDFARLHRDRPTHAGIVCIHQRTMKLGEMIRCLVEQDEYHEPDEMLSRLTYLP